MMARWLRVGLESDCQVSVLHISPTSCVILRKLPNLSVSSFNHLQNGDINNTYLLRMLSELVRHIVWNNAYHIVKTGFSYFNQGSSLNWIKHLFSTLSTLFFLSNILDPFHAIKFCIVSSILLDLEEEIKGQPSGQEDMVMWVIWYSDLRRKWYLKWPER